jgi:hypothetical protein
MMLVHSTDEHRAFVVGRQSALRSASDAVEQLTEQLIIARAELQQARADHAARMAALQARFDSEAAAMRHELSEGIAQLDSLRLLMFSKWQRHQTDALN